MGLDRRVDRLRLSPKDKAFIEKRVETYRKRGLGAEVEWEFPGGDVLDAYSYRVKVDQRTVGFWFTGNKYLGKRRWFSQIPLWTIHITLWTPCPEPEDEGERKPRSLGYAGALDHEQAWQQISNFIANQGRLYSSEFDVLMAEV